MMDEPTLAEWLDRHHVGIVRTLATLIDGTVRGEYVHRNRFEAVLSQGNPLPGNSLSGQAIYLAPDLGTLISDGTDANLGHVICDLVASGGSTYALCPRSNLKRLLAAAQHQGLALECGASLSFCLYADSFDSLRANHYHLSSLGSSLAPEGYRLHGAYYATAYMNEVIKRLEWKHISWQSWRNRHGKDQLELELAVTDPLTLADNLVRARMVMFEVAVDLGYAVTFMARPSTGVWNSLDFHLNLTPADDTVKSTVLHWLAGTRHTFSATTSFWKPTGNAASDLEGARPGHAVHLLASADSPGRISFAGGAANCNPYLVLAAVIAGGLAGIKAELSAEHVTGHAGDETYPGATLDMQASLAALADCSLLTEMLGARLVAAWLELQREEWRQFQLQTSAGSPAEVTDWEMEREFDRF